MTDSKNEIPKSPSTENSFKDFNKICRAYYNELMHISKSNSPNLSKEDIIVIDDLIKEISSYSSDLIKNNFIEEAKKIIDIGLVISDFLLKIFGEISDFEKKDKNLGEKLSYPLSLKLLLLECNFNILFKYEKNFADSEKNLDEIIEVQKYLKLSNYNLACSNFYMAIVKFYQNDLEKSEFYANNSLELLENKGNKEKKNDNKDNRKTRKMSNILEFLAEIYTLKKDYTNVLKNYEKAYYLNLGRYGATNVNTEYFKTKLDIASEEMKKYVPFSQISNTNLNNFNISSNSQLNKKNFSINQTNTSNNFNNNYSTFTQGMQPNILHKGKADTFSFKIPTSNLYEPLLISVYNIGEDDNNRYSPELFICNLCFDKMKLMKFLGENEVNNAIFYTDENLNNILCNIMVVNGYVSFLDNLLKNALINSNYKK
jgi:hypothetical protein